VVIGNIPDEFFYNLLPPVVQAVDTRQLIASVVGGFQDRVADLRYYTANVSNLMDPWSTTVPLAGSGYQAPRTILVSYIQQSQVPVTIPLMDDGTAPVDGPGLLTWSANQLQIDPSQVTAAVTGSDALRTLSVNQIELLADSLGATLYPGLPNELPAETALRQAKIVQSYFPRLSIKGTAQSFAALARLCGYDDGALIPLWSRISPRSPDLAVASVGDLNALPDFYPTAVLPDPFYNPSSLRDGPWFLWQSGSLYSTPSSSSYYTSVNGNNPYLTVIPQGTSTGVIQAGTYTFTGGAAQSYATVPFNSGYYSSNLIAQALVPGDTFNGMNVIVTNGGAWQQLSVLDQLSTVKFRSSYFDANVALTVADSGTTLVQANPDLINGLAMSDGTSTAPWRPWGGPLPRSQVPISTTQLDMDSLVAGAQRVLTLAQDDCIPATRLPRHLGAGVLWQDPTTFAAYTDLFVVPYTGSSYAFNGSNFGNVTGNSLPTGTTAVGWVLNGAPVPSESLGTWVNLETQYLTGSYNQVTGSYLVQASALASGTLGLAFTKLDSTAVNPEPSYLAKVAGLVGYQNRPAGTYVPPTSNITLSGSATLGQSSTTGTTISPLTYTTTDDVPWQRVRILAGGDEVSNNAFVPGHGDPVPISTGVEMDWLDQGGNPYLLRVIDITPTATVPASPPLPYRSQAVANPTPGPINPALASTSGSLVPMRLVGNLPVAVDALLPARTDHLLWWWPLVETSEDALVVTEAMSQVQVPLNTALPSDRTWGPLHGWKLNTWTGTAQSPALEIVNNKSNTYALGLRIVPSSITNPYVPVGAPFVTVGQLSVSMAGTASVYASFNAGNVYTTGTVGVLPNSANYVYASYNAGTVALRVRQNELGSFTGSSIAVGSPLITAPYVSISGVNPLTKMQDLCVWSGGTKSDAQLTVVDTPNFTSTVVAASLPFSYSLKGDRYSYSVLAQGFGQVSTTPPTVTSFYEDSTVIRYGGDGSYDADPRFKKVGLGENQPLPSVWKLGTQAGQPIMATGMAVMAGTQSPLPAFTYSFKGTAGSIDHQGPSPTTGFGPTGGVVTTVQSSGTALWAQDLNSVVDRLYLVGSDGSTYNCSVDNLGYGPVFVSNLVTRNQIFPQNGVITADCPTDRVADYFSGGSIIIPSGGSVISVSGSISNINYRGGSPTDLYMYTNSQLVASVTNPVTLLSNPTPFALQNNVAALDSAGDMTFILSRYAGGPAPLTFNFLVGNIGQLDPDFNGFYVTITVEAPNMAPASVPAVLMPNGSGVNPQVWQSVTVPITTSLLGTWRVSIDWTNDGTVPSRGWARQLAIYQFTARTENTSLVHVVTNPLTLTPLSVFAPITPLQPGAWVAHVTNSGTVYPAQHESLLYSPIIDNAFNYPVNPASNNLTGSTAARFSDLRTVSTYPLVNSVPPAPPVINSIHATPSGSNYLYQVGQSINLSANVVAANPRYVWSVGNSGVIGTLNPSYTTTFLAGGTQFGTLTVVDAIGQTGSTVILPFMVNTPPLINAVQAFPNDSVVPYNTNLLAYITPQANPYNSGTVSSFNVNWTNSAGTVFATGTSVPNYLVTQSQYMTVTAYDMYGGTSTLPFYLAGEAPNPPIISVADYTSEAYVNMPYTINAAALGYDPQSELLTPMWTFWDGGTTPGFVQPLTNFGTGSLFSVSRIISVPTPGNYDFELTVTNTSGQSSTVGAGINFTVNYPPSITSCQVVNGPQAIAGQPVIFAGAAVDPNGDPLNYNWSVMPGNVALQGPNVSYNTTGLAVGTVITAVLTVTDGFGGVATQTLPGVTVNASGLANCVIHPPSGELTNGINVVITPPSNLNISTGNIQYTVNGATPQLPTDGNTYMGPFQVTGTKGQTVVVQAVAFQSGFAPSVVATSTYTFA